MAVSSAGGATGISIVSVMFSDVSDDSTPGTGAAGAVEFVGREATGVATGASLRTTISKDNLPTET
jgi:hypothetical protein